MFFIIEKSEEIIFEFSKNSLIVVWFCLVMSIIQNGNSKDYKSIKWLWQWNFKIFNNNNKNGMSFMIKIIKITEKKIKMLQALHLRQKLSN